jgi:xanthine dehydrogenase accessory factor
MTTLIAPFSSESSVAYHETYRDALASGTGCTEAIPFEVGRSAETLPRYLFDGQDLLLAQSGKSPPTEAVRESLRSLNERPEPYVAAGVAYLPNLPTGRLVIIGAGHVGRALANYAKDVDFEVTVIDDREEYCNPTLIPRADRHMTGRLDDVLPALDVDSQTFCVIVTRGHNHDEEALLYLVRRQPAYLGMIGSRRKIKLIFDDLRREGVTDEQLARVHAPIGLDIGSRTVPEIAVSIVAELIACRNCPDDSNLVGRTSRNLSR